MTQGDSSLGCHGCKLISITPHTKKMKDKNHTTISADAEKAFDKIPLFTYKPSIDWLQKQRNVNIIKATYNKSTRNIILSGEKWKATIRNETGMLVLAFLFYCVFFFLAAPQGLWDLSSSTRDRTWASSSHPPQGVCQVLTTGPPGDSHDISPLEADCAFVSVSSSSEGDHKAREGELTSSFACHPVGITLQDPQGPWCWCQSAPPEPAFRNLQWS